MRDEDIHRRVERFVDRAAALIDARYHAEILFLKNLFVRIAEAMRDEGVDESVVERVINTLTYGTPYGVDAHERVELTNQRIQEALLHSPEIVPRDPFVQALLDGAKKRCG
jgi:hypothetical protein